MKSMPLKQTKDVEKLGSVKKGILALLSACRKPTTNFCYQRLDSML